MERPVELSVIMPAFNAAETIAAQLDALLTQKPGFDFEVLVADNGSTDGTRELVMRYSGVHPKVRLIDAAGCRGPSFARNTGAREARADLLAFCDADDVVGEHWLHGMRAALAAAQWASGPLERHALNPDWLVAAYGLRSETEMLWFADTFPFATTANLGIHKAVFHEIGEFDETMRVGEDVDLGFRLWRRGIEGAFNVEMVVHYRLRTDRRALFTQAFSYGRSAITLYRRVRRVTDPRHAPWRGLRNWLWLVRHLPILRSPEGRSRWLVVAGQALGRLVGSFTERTLSL